MLCRTCRCFVARADALSHAQMRDKLHATSSVVSFAHTSVQIVDVNWLCSVRYSLTSHVHVRTLEEFIFKFKLTYYDRVTVRRYEIYVGNTFNYVNVKAIRINCQKRKMEQADPLLAKSFIDVLK